MSMTKDELLEEIKNFTVSNEQVKLTGGELDGDLVFAEKGSDETDIASPTKENIRLVYKRTKTMFRSTFPVFRYDREIEWNYEAKD